MPTIDAQVHSYERNHPGRPWHAALTGPPEVTGDQMVAAMDAAGVDGAILVSAFTMYRYDAATRSRCTSVIPIVSPSSNPSIPPITPSRKSSRSGSALPAPWACACYLSVAATPRTPPIPASNACWRQPDICHCRSICTLPAGSNKGSSSSAAIPIRRSSSITSASFSRTAHRCRRSLGRSCRRCWRSQSSRTSR